MSLIHVLSKSILFLDPFTIRGKVFSLHQIIFLLINAYFPLIYKCFTCVFSYSNWHIEGMSSPGKSVYGFDIRCMCFVCHNDGNRILMRYEITIVNIVYCRDICLRHQIQKNVYNISSTQTVLGIRQTLFWDQPKQ